MKIKHCAGISHWVQQFRDPADVSTKYKKVRLDNAHHHSWCVSPVRALRLWLCVLLIVILVDRWKLFSEYESGTRVQMEAEHPHDVLLFRLMHGGFCMDKTERLTVPMWAWSRLTGCCVVKKINQLPFTAAQTELSVHASMMVYMNLCY